MGAPRLPSTQKNNNPSKPLDDPKHEAFCNAVVAGQKLQDAYRSAGFSQNADRTRAWLFRHKPHIDARIQALLKIRVDADTKRFVRRQNKIDDIRARALAELEKIAFLDIREVAQWDKRPVMSPDGEVIEIVDKLLLTPSAKLSPAAAAAIKGVTTKSGSLKVELHDKRAALETILKATGGFPTDDSPSSVTVNQFNVGAVDAIEAARRIAFALRRGADALPAPSPAPKTIDGEAVEIVEPIKTS